MTRSASVQTEPNQDATHPMNRARKGRFPRRPRVARNLLLTATVLLGAAGLSACNEANMEAADAVAYPPPGKLIDVGGHRLHLDCRGTGGPTVVIDAGWGDFSTPWHTVQSAVARTTRVCTYDRAGVGYSDPGPLPRDASHFEGELYTLLQRANVPGPYVMVGHSLGGLTARVFVHRHPAEVAGVVLIESMSPEGVGPTTTAAQPVPTPAATHAQGFWFLSAAARLGLVRTLAGPLGLAKGVPPEDGGAYIALTVTPGYFQAMADEGAGMPASLVQAGEVTSFGDLPLTVLSRGLDPDPVWQAKQRGLLRLSSRSTQVTAAHSTHTIEHDEPQAAVDAIVAMVKQVR